MKLRPLEESASNDEEILRSANDEETLRGVDPRIHSSRKNHSVY